MSVVALNLLITPEHIVPAMVTTTLWTQGTPLVHCQVSSASLPLASIQSVHSLVMSPEPVLVLVTSPGHPGPSWLRSTCKNLFCLAAQSWLQFIKYRIGSKYKIFISSLSLSLSSKCVQFCRVSSDGESHIVSCHLGIECL